MSTQVELVPLRCLRCSTLVPAAPEEVAWVCAQCGQGLLLEIDRGLVYLPVHYSAHIKPGQTGQPYWVCTGHVFVEREPYRGSSEKIARESKETWDQGRQFYLPAYAERLDELLARAQKFFQTPPLLEEGPAVPFAPVVLSPQDLPAAAEFLVLSVEAARKDKLRQVEVKVVLEAPTLWILP